MLVDTKSLVMPSPNSQAGYLRVHNTALMSPYDLFEHSQPATQEQYHKITSHNSGKMTDAPLSAAATKLKRKKRLTTNVNKKLLMELQAVIAYACYDSPYVSRGGTSMKESTMEIKMSELCFGDEISLDTESDIVCYEDQFLLGLNKFEGLYTVSSCSTAQAVLAVSAAPGSIFGRGGGESSLLTMLPSLHRQPGNINIFVGKGSIEKTLMSRKSLSTTGPDSGRVTGRTLLRYAKEVLCACKKMQALVTSAKSPYKNGTFPSGTNWDDYMNWCLYAMYESEQTVEDTEAADAGDQVTAATEVSGTKAAAEEQMAATGDQVTAATEVSGTEAAAEEQMAATGDQVTAATEVSGTEAAAEEQLAGTAGAAQGQGVLHTTEEVEEEQVVAAATDKVVENAMVVEQVTITQEGMEERKAPATYSFKGFIAWCLWGFIPVNDDFSMRSSLFSDSKTDSSHGRKTGSRRALLKQAGREPTVADERRGRKRKNINDEIATPMADDDILDASVSTSSQASNMASVISKTLAFMDSQNAETQMQRSSDLEVRILRDELAALRRKSDKLSQRFFVLKDQGADPAMLQQVDNYEAEIECLETKLKEVQTVEVQRRTSAIAARHHQPPSIILDLSPFVPVDSGGSVRGVPQRELAFDTPPAATTETTTTRASKGNDFICTECCIMSTTHTCRRCRRYVCDICCSTLRSLEMVWWCALCFDKESLSTQNLIREGNYNSDGDSNSVVNNLE
jgi:hypothetical protein